MSFLATNVIDLPQIYFVNGKNWERESGRLITDGEIDLGQVYVTMSMSQYVVTVAVTVCCHSCMYVTVVGAMSQYLYQIVAFLNFGLIKRKNFRKSIAPRASFLTLNLPLFLVLVTQRENSKNVLICWL